MLEQDFRMVQAQAEADIREAKRQRKNNFLLTAQAVGIETLTYNNLKLEALKVYYNGVYGYIPKNLMDDYEFKSLQSFTASEYTFFVEDVFEENGEFLFLANRKDALAYQATQLWKKVKPGQVYNAFVSGVDRFNIWLLINGERVQMNREDYSYKFIKDLQLEVFIGDRFDVKVTEVDVENKKIEVSRKVLEADPRTFLRDYKVGATYACTVENIDVDYGVFVSLHPKGVIAKAGFPPMQTGRLLKEGATVNFKITWMNEDKGLVGGLIIIPRLGQINKALGQSNGR